jgi:hypothetical protein
MCSKFHKNQFKKKNYFQKFCIFSDFFESNCWTKINLKKSNYCDRIHRKSYFLGGQEIQGQFDISYSPGKTKLSEVNLKYLILPNIP